MAVHGTPSVQMESNIKRRPRNELSRLQIWGSTTQNRGLGKRIGEVCRRQTSSVWPRCRPERGWLYTDNQSPRNKIFPDVVRDFLGLGDSAQDECMN